MQNNIKEMQKNMTEFHRLSKSILKVEILHSYTFLKILNPETSFLFSRIKTLITSMFRECSD